MQLQPVTESREASYPVSKAKAVKVMGRWIRRVGVAVATSTIMAFWVGCATGGEAVDIDYYYENCDDNDPAPEPDFQIPGTFSRYLCPGQSTFAEVTVENQRTIRLNLYDDSYDSGSDVIAVLADPQGAAAASLDEANNVVELALTPGTWRITVTQRSSSAEGEFDLDIDDLDL